MQDMTNELGVYIAQSQSMISEEKTGERIQASGISYSICSKKRDRELAFEFMPGRSKPDKGYGNDE